MYTDEKIEMFGRPTPSHDLHCSERDCSNPWCDLVGNVGSGPQAPALVVMDEQDVQN